MEALSEVGERVSLGFGAIYELKKVDGISGKLQFLSLPLQGLHGERHLVVNEAEGGDFDHHICGRQLFYFRFIAGFFYDFYPPDAVRKIANDLPIGTQDKAVNFSFFRDEAHQRVQRIEVHTRFVGRH